MSAPTQKDLTRYRALVNATLTSTAVVARTGASLPCRVDMMTREQRVGAITDFIHTLRRRVILAEAANVQTGDLLTVTNADSTPMGLYLLAEMANYQSFSYDTHAEAIHIDSLQVASVERAPTTAPVAGSISGYTTIIPTLNLWNVAGGVLHPITPQAAKDAFGVNVVFPAKCYASWPSGHTEDLPIRTGDRLLIGANMYVVQGLMTYQQLYIEIVIEVRQ